MPRSALSRRTHLAFLESDDSFVSKSSLLHLCRAAMLSTVRCCRRQRSYPVRHERQPNDPRSLAWRAPIHRQSALTQLAFAYLPTPCTPVRRTLCAIDLDDCFTSIYQCQCHGGSSVIERANAPLSPLCQKATLWGSCWSEMACLA